MSRWKAASIHLSISIFVGLLTLALLFLVWFPQPYFEAAGGQHLIIVLLGVDLVLGPLLTLILFKSGKRGMVFDLWMIGIVQSTALVYGLYVIAEARPVFIVAAVDRFNVISAADLAPEDLAQGSKPEFRTLSWTGPRLVAARLPTDAQERTDLMFQSVGGKDVQHYPKYYVDYTDASTELLQRAKPLADLRQSRADSAPLLDGWLQKHDRTEGQIAFIPVLARQASLTMLLDANSGEVLGALPIDPW
jgi:hypothetical protein